MEVTRVAARHGYEHVSMRDIARQARMSMTTIYQYCGSKDHLIAEAHLEWMEQFAEDLAARPPRGRTAKARVLAVLRRLTAWWIDEAEVAATLMRAVYALDPGVRRVRAQTGATHRTIMETAIGDDAVAHRSQVVDIVGHLLNSVTYSWVAGSITAAEARATLQRDVAALFDSLSVHPAQ